MNGFQLFIDGLLFALTMLREQSAFFHLHIWVHVYGMGERLETSYSSLFTLSSAFFLSIFPFGRLNFLPQSRGANGKKPLSAKDGKTGAEKGKTETFIALDKGERKIRWEMPQVTEEIGWAEHEEETRRILGRRKKEETSKILGRTRREKRWDRHEEILRTEVTWGGHLWKWKWEENSD